MEAPTPRKEGPGLFFRLILRRVGLQEGPGRGRA